MAIKDIKESIQLAKKQAFNQQNSMVKMRQQASVEDFKTLFKIRAQQAMTIRKNFGDFVIDESNREVLNIMYRYIVKNNCPINPYIGIILNGAYGCGKSVLIETFCQVLNDLTSDKSEQIKVVHAIELAEDIKINGVIKYARIPLCIQDLGKEKKEVNHYGTMVNPISELLAVRAEYGALTFGSTNMTLKMFEEAYKEYISKRITEHVNLVYLPGCDRRPNYSLNQPKP